jgi:ornithine cyclodeaminase/alanine dehydrogenase-like protein (mu-crystallin family)
MRKGFGEVFSADRCGADLVCTVTSSREPVLMGEWLSPGVHVNAAGLKALRRGHFISR